LATDTVVCNNGSLKDKGETSKNRPTYFTVLVVGAGESGIAVGCSLKAKLGFSDFKILDGQSGVGGECLDVEFQ
jgi:hypothetical protein